LLEEERKELKKDLEEFNEWAAQKEKEEKKD
jgi:hypothetical protein